MCTKATSRSLRNPRIGLSELKGIKIDVKIEVLSYDKLCTLKVQRFNNFFGYTLNLRFP